MAASLPPTHRPRDYLYGLFFLSHILIITFFDSLTLYPPSIAPRSLLSLHEWYKTYYNDQLVISQPAWFRFFTLIEVFYQLPAAAWSIWALRSKSYRAPLHILILSLVIIGTTVTCLFEIYHNALMSNSQKLALYAMYGSYAVILGAIGLDMFFRIQRVLHGAATLQKLEKKN